ncbi:MAG: FAD-dependent oxidoreductase, partial [Deltaproteobacteria bacterium]|nr:FAD-dependent oxidoreductase [Deltaproteobacteria bacterium]
DTEDMFKYLMMAGGPTADEAKVRLYCESSLDHYRWLTDKGIQYKESFHKDRAIMALNDDCLLYTGNEKAWPFVEKAKPCPRGHNIEIDGDNGGPVLMNTLTEQVNKRDNVTVHYDSRVVTLVADDANEVQGVLARIDMKERFVRARKGVILCAGGFVMNDEMLKKYIPGLLGARDFEKVGSSGDMGTGILMGVGAGGATLNMSEHFISLPYYPPADLTFGILVNSAAQRFVNEDVYHGRVGYMIERQIGEKVYFIFPLSDDFQRPMFLMADVAGTGETVEELAEDLGLDADALTNTIELYNKYSERGEDAQFHKAAEWLRPLEAPYAALDCSLDPGYGAIFPHFTLGGLDTLPTGEVLAHDREPIPGLYAAGRTACGLPRWGGGYSSGMSVGDATFFGRMAGKTVAARASR